jgi:hypothetical protein
MSHIKAQKASKRKCCIDGGIYAPGGNEDLLFLNLMLT